MAAGSGSAGAKRQQQGGAAAAATGADVVLLSCYLLRGDVIVPHVLVADPAYPGGSMTKGLIWDAGFVVGGEVLKFRCCGVVGVGRGPGTSSSRRAGATSSSMNPKP